MTEAYKQSSLVVPIAMPQRPLPPYISLDSSSQWHTSALLATALESVTLPSRLKNNANRDTLGTTTELLNVMGKQSIASLQLSVQKPETDKPDGQVQGRGDSNKVQAAEDQVAEWTQLDVNFTPPDELAFGRGRQARNKKARLFGQTLVDRGSDFDSEPAGSVDMEELISRRHAQQPISRR